MLTFFNKRLHNKKGFTLIELIVVIAILGILIAIAVPRLGGFTDTAQDAADDSTARVLEGAVAMYHAEYGDYPENLSDASEYMETGFDSWNDYNYDVETGEVTTTP